MLCTSLQNYLPFVFSIHCLFFYLIYLKKSHLLASSLKTKGKIHIKLKGKKTHTKTMHAQGKHMYCAILDLYLYRSSCKIEKNRIMAVR